MAQIDLSQTASPLTPSAGYDGFYFDNVGTGNPKYVDSSGVVHSMGCLSTWFDVTAYGLKGDGSFDNLAALNTLIQTTAPLESTLFFPAGTYNFSGEIAINNDKLFRFLGCGRGLSILQTTHATAHMFNISVAGYYASFEELGFTASLTKTAGAFILASNNNAYLNVTGCEMQKYFAGVQLTGAIAANLGTISDCQFNTPATNGQGIIINGSSINMTILNCTLNHVPNAGGTGQCIEINQCGAVQIDTCDVIGGVNSLRINATATVSAVKVTNTFFDQGGGSTVKIMGTSASSRISFISGGITSGTLGTHGLEINGTGGTLPGGIDVIGVDIYNTFGSPTNAGILINGCQDINIQSCRISGFQRGIEANASTGSITKLIVSGNTIGPTENFSGNATGINIVAGTYGAYMINNNNVMGNTTANITDAGSVATTDLKVVNNNLGQRLVGAVATNRGGVTSGTTETLLFNARIPANAVAVGTTFKITVWGQSSSTGTLIFSLRAGAAGTVAGDTQVVVTATSVAQAASSYAMFECLATVVALGATGNVAAHGFAIATGLVLGQPTAAEVIANAPTTAAWFLDVACTCSVGTFTVR